MVPAPTAPPCYDASMALAPSLVDSNRLLPFLKPRRSPLTPPASTPASAPSPTLPSQPAQICKLKKLGANGTLLKHGSSATPRIEYNCFNTEENPPRTLHDSKSLRVELELASDRCYMPALDLDFSADSTSLTNVSQPQNGLVSGILHVTVKGTTPQLLKNIHVRISGYCSKFACSTATGSPTEKSKVVHLRDFSHSSSPFVQDAIHFSTNGVELLPPGSYDYRFDFVLDSTSYPASIRTHYGSTAYRVEALITTPKPKQKYETLFLTTPITIKKSLHHDFLNLYESTTAHHNWRDGQLFCDMFLSSRLIEFDRPFQLKLQLSRPDLEYCTLLFANISIVQTLSLPCIDSEKRELLPSSYCQSNSATISRTENLDNNLLYHDLTFDELVVPSTLKTALQITSFFPHYREPFVSGKPVEQGRFGLQITHELKIKIGIKINDSDTGKVQLVLKIPLLLIDNDMGCSSQLPLYEPHSPFPLSAKLVECSSSESSSLVPPDYIE